MALDNPSYFSIAGGAEETASNFALFKHPTTMGNSLDSASASTSSESSLKQTTPTLQDRKSRNRSLLRSVSTNSADSNQELLIKGEPRLSDIAPELTFKYPVEPRRANSLKSNRSDVIYSPLATADSIECEASDDENVFLSEDSARFYNVASKAGGASQRRHSISAFMGRERPGNVREDFGQAIVHATPEGTSVRRPTVIAIDDHSLRHSSYPRKRCNRCPRGPTRRADMDDILIISAKESDPAALWVEYFISYFEQVCKSANKKPYKIHHLGIEDVLNLNGDLRLIAEKTSCVKLQLIILCPIFLEKIAENISTTCALAKIMLPDRILALQLGTKDEDVTNTHRNALSGFAQWQRRSVGQDQDEHFTSEFVTTATAIFTKIWKQQSLIQSEENSQFSVSPKKIRHGQTSVLIILTYQLQKDDIVKVSILKNNELTEVKTVKRRNPYTIKISIPEKFLDVSSIVNILVEKNGSVIGKRPIKCESRLRELEQILRSSNNPVEFMCQSLGFTPYDNEHLDNWMVHTFQKNIPPNFGLFNNSNNCNHIKHSCEEHPTLLHFAARYGLEKLTVQLLDCPGGDVACEIRNVNDLMPTEIAENAGHKEIANMLRGYMKMNELAVVYSKIKNLMTETNESTEHEEEGYLTPRNASNDFYKVCPAPKPFIPSTPSPTIPEEPTQYLAMDTGKSSPISEPTPSPSPSTEPFPFPQSHPQSSKSKIHHHTSSHSINFDTKHQSIIVKSAAIDDKMQDLAEIINDFKNNVHTIDQTEQLVAEWQNRNDVQKSFKEKQEQLKQMRVRYEQIQRDMKAGSKRTSAFDRIRRMFAWGSKEDKMDAAGGQKGDSLGQRPISSLSIQSTTSSTSSGRMSTISGCSLGDSGTHSDHEERKTVSSIQSEEDFRQENTARLVNFNYLIPPTPKPIKTFNTFPPIEERPITKQDEIDNFYIQFPPNGLPVDQSVLKALSITEDNSNLAQQEYINFPMQDSNCSHDYMNIKSS